MKLDVGTRVWIDPEADNVMRNILEYYPEYDHGRVREVSPNNYETINLYNKDGDLIASDIIFKRDSLTLQNYDMELVIHYILVNLNKLEKRLKIK